MDSLKWVFKITRDDKVDLQNHKRNDKVGILNHKRNEQVGLQNHTKNYKMSVQNVKRNIFDNTISAPYLLDSQGPHMILEFDVCCQCFSLVGVNV